MAENYYQEACELVAQLLEARSLRENEREFVDGLHVKLEQYGERAFLSAKQMNWLRALAKEHWRDPRQMSLI